MTFDMRMRGYPACSQLPLAVILAPRARPRHNGFVVHAWLHHAGCRAVRTARSWRGIVAFTHPRTGGAHDSHHRTAGIAGRTRRHGSRLAARGHAQQSEQAQRVGVLMGLAEDDPDAKARLAGLRQGLESLGWSEGRNIR